MAGNFILGRRNYTYYMTLVKIDKGFSSIAIGCVKQIAINDVYYDVSNNLSRCPLYSGIL